jgi:hypothetical protein
MGTLREDQYTFLILSCSFLLRMRNVPDKSCRENQKTHFVFNKFFSKIVPFVIIMWKNMVQSDRPRMRIWRMRIACWIPKATNTHSVYAIFIALPLQQWLHERASVLRQTWIAILPVTAVQAMRWCHLPSTCPDIATSGFPECYCPCGTHIAPSLWEWRSSQRSYVTAGSSAVLGRSTGLNI